MQHYELDFCSEVLCSSRIRLVEKNVVFHIFGNQMKKVPNDIFHQMKKQALGNNRQHLCNLLLLDLKGMSVFAGVFTEHQSSSV